MKTKMITAGELEIGDKFIIEVQDTLKENFTCCIRIFYEGDAFHYNSISFDEDYKIEIIGEQNENENS